MDQVLRRACLVLIVVLALAAPAWAAVALDATASGHCGGAGGETACGGGGLTLTYALTVGAGSNRQLAVVTEIGCASASPAAPSITGITYATVALTQISTSANNAGGACSANCVRTDLWALPAGTQPTTGTGDVVVTLSATTCTGAIALSLQSGAFAVTGVDQTTTFTANNTANGNGSAASVTLASSGTDDLVIFSACSGASVANNGNSVGTQRYRNDTGTGSTCDSAAGATAPGGNTTLAWTTTVETWNIVAASFKASTAVGGYILTEAGDCVNAENADRLITEDVSAGVGPCTAASPSPPQRTLIGVGT